MSQFTREFIVNDATAKATKANGFVDFAGLLTVRESDIFKTYHAVGSAAEKEKLTWKPTLVGDGDYRLIVTLTQENNIDAGFATATPTGIRTIVYEFKPSIFGDKEKTVAKDPYMTIKASTASEFKFEAVDCYTRIKGIKVVQDVVVEDSNIGIGETTTVDEWDRTKSGLTAGSVGVGTTTQILRNMRLQTDANLNPYGIDTDERPVPNSVYDQYTVELVTERRNIGHGVMGSVDHSLTTLVFYVLKGGNFFAELGEATGKVDKNESESATAPATSIKDTILLDTEDTGAED